jgi:hypothetical protein
MDQKPCSKCGVVKPFSEYHKASGEKLGIRSACKLCIALRYADNKERFKVNSAAWYQANKERKSATVAAWKERNRDSFLEYQKEYYEANKDRKLEFSRNWKAANREKVNFFALVRRRANIEKERERNRLYSKANPHKMTLKVSMRRAAKYRATPVWANREMIAAVYSEASRLTRETGIEHHVDHIVPLRSELVCGLHNEFNLQILPGSENLLKGNRHWPDMP